MNFLEKLSERRRFGIKPGLDAIRLLCARLDNPQDYIKAIHIAGTNGKGAVAAMLEACLYSSGLKTGRYTSPHLVNLNERFFINSKPVDDSALQLFSSVVESAVISLGERAFDITFFEALTAVAFSLYKAEQVDVAVLETGLGGRLDATNICLPKICVITRIGLDHCDWLGHSLKDIACEKAGIIKCGIPIVLGANDNDVYEVVKARSLELGCEFYYAPEIVKVNELPENLALKGSFNRENAITALAVLKVILQKGLFSLPNVNNLMQGFANVIWPGRFQYIGNFLVDGAHNPPAARALAKQLSHFKNKFVLVAGFCGDKDVSETLEILSPYIECAFAVKTNNPRSLEAQVLCDVMGKVGIKSTACSSLNEALKLAQACTYNIEASSSNSKQPYVLVCGSLFLAGEALVALNAYPWGAVRFDPSESLHQTI